MAYFRSAAGSAIPALLLAGCAAMTPPVDVTRFHNAETAPIAGGTIALEAQFRDQADGSSIEYATYAAALRHELQKAGFSESGASNDDSAYVGQYTIERARIGAGGSRSPVSVGVGGSTGSYGSGVGLGIGINLGGRPKDKIATELALRIRSRDSGTIVWEGRASVEAKEGSPASQPGLAASKLAEALFRDFPGESGTTIRVP